jgi:2-dehydro-3-deoxy-D-arabinonate dehydratase
MQIKRGGFVAFIGDTFTSKMKRTFEDLAHYLCRELDFPHGVLLMTGTGIVPSDNFTLQAGDVIRVTIGDLALENTVA